MHNTVRYTAGKTTDDVSPTDESDYSCSTYSYTGDSGFSDSREFLQKQSPPSSPQHTSAQIERILDSDASYTSLITADVRNAEYYKTLNRECIPGMHRIRHFLIGLVIHMTVLTYTFRVVLSHYRGNL